MLTRRIFFLFTINFICVLFIYPETVYAKRLIRVGLFQNYPIVFQDKDGNPNGIYIDLLKEIAKTEDWQIVYVPATWNHCLENLRNRKIDLMTNITYTEARDSYIDFSKENVLMMWGQVYVGKGKEVQNIIDLNGFKIAILKGGINAINFSNLINKFQLECQLIPVDTQLEVLEMTSSGQTDAGVLNNVFGAAHEANYNVNLSPIFFNPFNLLVAVPEGINGEILKVIDENLRRWKQDKESIYYKILQKWYGTVASQQFRFPRWLFFALIGIGCAAILFMLWMRLLKKQVSERTFELQKEVDERKQAEEALRISEEKLQLIIDTSPVGICTVDPLGNFVTTNLAFEQMVGYAKEEFRDLSFFDVTHPDDRPNNKKLFQDMFSLKTTGFFVEKRYIRKDGTNIEVAVHASEIMDVDRNARFGTAFVEDITERKRSEQEKKKLQVQLIQAQKMESIGNLAGGIAHDFNNILSSVIGFTELSLDEVEKGTHIEDNLQEVYTAGTRAKDLVGQILAFARQSDDELKPVQVDAVATEVLKFIRSSIPTTIEIKQNIESDSLIMGNATKVHQVLMNLFTNAAHAMEDKGGILEFSLKDVVVVMGVNREMLDLTPGNYIEIKVSDTGVGIVPEIIGSIFDPYFTTKGIGEGTGMGLAMVHGIIKDYGGKISVNSKPDQGTLFAIYLPVTRKRQENRPYQSEELPTGTERILFVDDEAPIAKMGGQTLEKLGYNVSIRTSSIEALELFRTKPNDFDLVITDMTMPNMTGDRLAIGLMKIRPDIPVIICTGYSKKMSDKSPSEMGIKAFVFKPIVKADLSKTVRKVLDDQKKLI